MTSQTFSFIAGCIGICAFLLSVIAPSWCEFAHLSLTTGQEINFGLWGYSSFGLVIDTNTKTAWKIETCEAYPSDIIDMDPAWKASRAFGILAPVFGFIAVVLAICNNKNCANMTSALFLLATLFQGLLFLFLRSNACDSETNPVFEEYPNLPIAAGSCYLGRMAVVCIVATIVWFIAALVAVKAAISNDPEDEQQEEARDNKDMEAQA